MSCKPSSRRQFLVQSGCGLITMAALGLPSGAEALPISFAAGEPGANEQRYPLPAADGVTIDSSAQVILVRYANHIYAMALACPHEHAAVKWMPRDGRFQCSKHNSRYTPEGAYTSGRATRNLDRFPIRREGDTIVVAVDRVFRSDQDSAGWSAASVTV